MRCTPISSTQTESNRYQYAQPMPMNHPVSEAHSQLAIARMPDGVVVQDATGSIRSFNAAALQVLGLTSDQLLGRTSFDPEWRTIDVRSRPFPGDRHPAIRCIELGTEQLGVIMGVSTPSHDVRWLRVDSYPATVEGGRGAVTIFADITAAHNADDEVRRLLRLVQESLLPEDDTWTGNVHAASWYRAAGGTSLVGGDFFDVIDVEDSTVFFIGDITGHGFEAAVATALARYTLRAAALQRSHPAAALDLLDRSLRSERSGQLCTALYGVIEPAGDDLSVTLCAAGHPPALLLSDAGAVAIGGRGPLLGAELAESTWTAERVTVGPGEQLFCYTDGLTDTVRPRLDDRDLAGMVVAGQTPHETIDLALKSLPGTWIENADDVAILVLAAPQGQTP